MNVIYQSSLASEAGQVQSSGPVAGWFEPRRSTYNALILVGPVQAQTLMDLPSPLAFAHRQHG